jgi:hypothetical protein
MADMGVSFVLDNILGPFLTDLTSGALNYLNQSFSSLLGLLVGKRNEFVTENILNPFLEDVNTNLNNFLQNLLNDFLASLFGK